MSELRKFDELVKRARHEAPPMVDVSDDVAAAIRVMPVRRAEPMDRLVLAFAATAVLAASIVAMLAWQLVEQPMVAEVPNPFVVSVMASR